MANFYYNSAYFYNFWLIVEEHVIASHFSVTIIVKMWFLGHWSTIRVDSFYIVYFFKIEAFWEYFFWKRKFEG